MADAQEFQAKPIAALGFNAEQGVALNTLGTPEAQAAVQRGQELRVLKNKGATGQDIITEVAGLEAKKFTKETAIDLGFRFGAGFAREDTTAVLGSKIDVAAPRLAKDNFDRAKQEIDTISSIVQYSEIQQEAKGSSLPAALAKRSMSTTEWNTLREKSLDGILAHPKMVALYPELSQITNVYNRREFIEKTLAQDPALRDKIVTGMRSVQKAAAEFPPVAEVNPVSAAKEKHAKEIRDQVVERTLNYLKGEGFTTIPTGFDKELKKLVEQGAAPEFIADRLRQEAMNGLTDDQRNFVVQATAYQRSIESDTSTISRAAKLKEFADFFDKPAHSTVAYYKAKVVFNQLRGEKNGDQYKSSLIQDIAVAIGNYNMEMTSARETKASTQVVTDIANRNLKEAETLDILDNVLGNAITEVSDARYKKAGELHMQDVSEKMEKTKSAAAKKVGEAISTNWIRKDEKGRKEITDRGRIGKDVRFIIYQGKENGIKRLMLRDMGVANWQKVDLTALSADQKAGLDEAYSTYESNYGQKLVEDFFRARNGADRTIHMSSLFKWEIPLTTTFGNLALKDYELRVLREMFGDILNEKKDIKENINQRDQEEREAGINQNLRPFLDPNQNAQTPSAA